MVSRHVGRLVSIASKVRIALVQILQGVETFYLEYFWLTVDDFSLEGSQCGLRVEEERPGRKAEISLTETKSMSVTAINVSQPEGLEVGLGLGCLTDGPGGEIDHSVAVRTDLGEETRHLALGPVTKPYEREQHSSDVTPGDGPVNVTDDDLVLLVPDKDVTLTPRGALELSGHTEHHLIAASLEVVLGQVGLAQLQLEDPLGLQDLLHQLIQVRVGAGPRSCRYWQRFLLKTLDFLGVAVVSGSSSQYRAMFLLNDADAARIICFIEPSLMIKISLASLIKLH